jgi:hypothetical protein
MVIAVGTNMQCTLHVSRIRTWHSDIITGLSDSAAIFTDMYMSMHRLILLVISFLTLSVSGTSYLGTRGLEHPQTNVSLVYPEGPVTVGVGQYISLGVADLQSGLGFRTDMVITLDHEDGNPEDHQEAPFKQACSAVGYHGPFIVGFHVEKIGR